MEICGYRVRLKSYANLIVPIIFTAVLIYYMAGSWDIMNTVSMVMMKPVGILMVFSLLFIIKQELIIQKMDDTSAEEETFFSSKENRTKFIVYAILTILYALAFNYAGFILATLIVPAATMFYGGVRSIKMLTFMSILLTVIVYVAFRIILRVNLPTGVLGI